MSQDNSSQEYFPLKPRTEEGFKRPVSWLGGRELISSLKGTIIYSINGENTDPRSWMKANIFPAVDDKEMSDAKAFDQAWLNKVTESENWKRKYFQFWDNYLRPKDENDEKEKADSKKTEFWFDYIADSGDGQMGVYGVACLCLSDLWIKNEEIGETVSFNPPEQDEEKKIDKATLLPRGNFLFVGGDTAYHVADYSTIHERIQIPFRWAFADVRKFLTVKYKLKPEYKLKSEDSAANNETLGLPRQDGKIFTDGKEWKNWDGMFADQDCLDTEPPRPLFGVPANHDYYDGIDGFNRQFRRSPFDNLAENKRDPRFKGGNPLSLPTFQREQEASYVALHLPFDWWFLGIDSENKKLDFRQRVFYKELMEKWKPKKLILATPEPTTVFGRQCSEVDKTAIYLSDITQPVGLEQPFLKCGEILPLMPSETEKGQYCRLDLSGDVHHYARYWGPDTSNYKKEKFASDHYASLVSGGGGAFFDATETLIGKSQVYKNDSLVTVPGEIPPQKTFPDFDQSRNATAERIFNLSNIRKGGYVQIAGALIAIIVFYGLAEIRDIQRFFLTKEASISRSPSGLYAVFYFLSCIVLFGGAVYFLHDLVQQLKDFRAKVINAKNKNKKGRISELKPALIFFVVGLVVYLPPFVGKILVYLPPFVGKSFTYLFQFLPFNVNDFDIFSTHSGYDRSLELLFHFIIAGLVVWISIEYSNWLPIRFKLFSDSKLPQDGWINLFTNYPIIKNIDDFLGRKSNWIGKLWQALNRLTVENIPIFILNGFAIAISIYGIMFFGKEPLRETAYNLLFTTVVVGVFLGVIAFAVIVGAAYQGPTGKITFFLIGLWHSLLQILTPLILIYCCDWRFFIGLYLLTVITNSPFLRGGALIMKQGSTALLSISWVIYGLIFILSPYFSSKPETIHHLLLDQFGRGNGLSLYLSLFLLIVGYLGHRMSRVWFSWYLAVSLAFNGHNNEAGGAARLEDFKHILRIKLEENKLTVYVIGFEKAATEIEKLDIKLVDKFELKCKEIT